MLPADTVLFVEKQTVPLACGLWAAVKLVQFNILLVKEKIPSSAALQGTNTPLFQYSRSLDTYQYGYTEKFVVKSYRWIVVSVLQTYWSCSRSHFPLLLLHIDSIPFYCTKHWVAFNVK